MEEGLQAICTPPSLGLGGGLLSWWTYILIGSFPVGGWEPGTPPDWSGDALIFSRGFLSALPISTLTFVQSVFHPKQILSHFD